MNKKSLAKVKVLINGYTTADSKEADEEKTCATITLIKDGKLVMVIDSGVLESRKMLIDALKKEKLSLEDVNVVGLTHSHIDHYASVGMFPNAKILEFYGLWDKNKCDEWNE
ncbi:MAG: MBL fold metallo-hydrolase [Patescibacteria group bacterium]